MNINQVQDARVKQLAQTLKNNGLAASDTQAIQMAQNMTQTETKVIKQASDNKSSMVRNYDVNKGDMPRMKAAPQEQAQEETQPSQQPWENEVKAQGQPAEQAPVPNFANQALNDAITNVQHQFGQPATEEFSQMSVMEAAGEQQETIAQEPTAPMSEPQPQQIPLEEPAPTAEQPASIVENPLPSEETRMPVQEPHEESAAAPSQEYSPATAAPTAEQPAAPAPEDNQPERTQEMTTPTEQRPAKDLSKFEESRVSLADVFNFNK